MEERGSSLFIEMALRHVDDAVEQLAAHQWLHDEVAVGGILGELFEFNDEVTRANFVNIVEPFLRDVQAKRGVYDFLVICDTTNNTPDVIDSNEFRADIYIKPAKSINFVSLTFVATRTGVSFSEVAGRV